MFYGHILRFIPQDQRAPVCACVRARVPVRESVSGHVVPPGMGKFRFSPGELRVCSGVIYELGSHFRTRTRVRVRATHATYCIQMG